MRMDPSEGETALELIARLTDEDLANVIYEYGEEKRSRRIARSLKRAFADNQLETTLKVNGILVPVVPGRDYEISFDARWVAGSPQLHTELYYNKIAATTIK